MKQKVVAQKPRNHNVHKKTVSPVPSNGPTMAIVRRKTVWAAVPEAKDQILISASARRAMSVEKINKSKKHPVAVATIINRPNVNSTRRSNQLLSKRIKDHRKQLSRNSRTAKIRVNAAVAAEVADGVVADKIKWMPKRHRHNKNRYLANKSKGSNRQHKLKPNRPSVLRNTNKRIPIELAM